MRAEPTQPQISPTLDLAMTRWWIGRLYQGSAGLLSLAHVDASGRFHGAGDTFSDIDALLARIAQLDGEGARGIYLRNATLTSIPEMGARGGAEDSYELPGLWADVDFGTLGHKRKPSDRALPLPPNHVEAARIVHQSGLPAPSLWVLSGGGWYPWWLFERPIVLTDENRADVAAVSTALQEVLERSAKALGYAYGDVGDLARVLRVPGTINRKADAERPCTIAQDNGLAYTFEELAAAVAALMPPPEPGQAPAPVHESVRALGGGESAFDILDRTVSFDDILTGAGWRRHDRYRHSPDIDECWTRPGDAENPCSAHTLSAQPNVLVVWSDAAGLPVGADKKNTRGRVFAHLNHGGDTTAAANDIFAAIAGRPSTTAAAAFPLPREDRPVVTHAVADQLTGLIAPVGTENPGDAEPDPNALFNQLVEIEFQRLRVRKAAQERLRIEQTPPQPPFDIDTLGGMLARPTPPPDRFFGLIPSNAGTLIVAQRKTGKTTLNLNVAKSLVDGDPFLGQFDVRPIREDSCVAILNYEVSGHTLAAWADEAGIPHDRLVQVNLRGRSNPLADKSERARLADMLRGYNVEALIVDPFGRAYTGTNQNDTGEVTAWLAELDIFARTDVGASDLILAAHAGWGSTERARGASALEDWADSIIVMTKDQGNRDSDKRYLRALGRDVDVDEDELIFDRANRRLTLARTGSRRQASRTKTDAYLATFVVRALRSKGGRIAGRAVMETCIRGMEDAPDKLSNGAVASAAEYAASKGWVTIDSSLGNGKPKIYTLTEQAKTLWEVAK